MFSSNLALKATIQAEKVKEKEENKMAARYVKIRALLDEAERAINATYISRSLKNKLMAKHVKARKALDSGLNVEEVIEIMTLIVTMISQEIRQDKEAIEATTIGMRRNLDTFYKYDFEKFLEREHLTRQFQSESSVRFGRPRSQSRETSKANARFSWKRSPSEGHVSSPSPAPLESQRSGKKSPLNQSTLVTVRKNVSKEVIGPTKILEDDDNEEKLLLSDNEEMETFKRDITSAGIESLEDDGAAEEEPVVEHSLETLTLALSIIQELPNLVLNQNQHDYLAPTMRATKRLLMTPQGCAALSDPLNMLKVAIETSTNGAPKEPLFTQSLVEICMVISSFEGV